MMKILKNKLNKKIMISLILVGFIAIGSTLAYLFDISSLVTNTFSRASIHTDIKEETDTDLTKKPIVVNKDVTDVIVRVRLSISNKELFREHFGLAGIDDKYTSVYTDETKKTPADQLSYWTKEAETSDSYDCYYYYKYVLKGKETNSNGNTTQHQTEPLFDKILKKNENGSYKKFEYNIDGLIVDKNDIETLKLLESIDITIYQESVPVTVTKADGTVLNADPNGTGNVYIDQAKQIFDYFESNPADTESNN